MLLYQQKQRSKSNVKQNGVEGIYVPREGRIEQKRAFCSAHFSLGNPNQSKSSSIGPSLFMIVLVRYATSSYENKFMRSVNLDAADDHFAFYLLFIQALCICRPPKTSTWTPHRTHSTHQSWPRPSNRTPHWSKSRGIRTFHSANRTVLPSFRTRPQQAKHSPQINSQWKTRRW